MSEDSAAPVKHMALAMPDTAELVAYLRTMLGTERVNAALAAGQRAAREYARIAAERGPAQAEAWRARQTWPNGRFWASEGGLEVGVKRPC